MATVSAATSQSTDCVPVNGTGGPTPLADTRFAAPTAPIPLTGTSCVAMRGAIGDTPDAESQEGLRAPEGRVTQSFWKTMQGDQRGQES
jgi:hypothetical protein